jgi:hypothetical protein
MKPGNEQSNILELPEKYNTLRSHWELLKEHSQILVSPGQEQKTPKQQEFVNAMKDVS